MSIEAGADQSTQVDFLIKEFRAKMRNGESVEKIVRANILHGSAFAIEDEARFALLDVVATQFELDANQELFVVGSAKLGFSIAPKKDMRRSMTNRISTLQL